MTGPMICGCETGGRTGRPAGPVRNARVRIGARANAEPRRHGGQRAQERLTAIVAASGARDARVVVFPTALRIAFGRADWATIGSIPQFAGGLRLEQISALYELIHEAEHGKIAPAEGMRA